MSDKEVIECLENLNLREFIRVYLHVNEKFKEIKDANPRNMSSAMFAVKNPEIVRDMKKRSYQKRKESKTEAKQ